MLRIVARRGDGYASCRIHYASFGRCLICWYCAQSFNSLDQNPCTVAAYLMSTCNGGCKLSSSLLCPCIFELVVSSESLSQHSPSTRWPRDTTTRGQVVMMTPICASATPSHIPSLVHVSHAKEKSGCRTDPPSLSFSNHLGLCIDLRWPKYTHNCTKVLPSSS
jgi:hypothetical protein